MANDILRFAGRDWTVDDLAEITGPLHVIGYLDVRGYGHPLPSGLTSVGGSLYVQDYGHPLPAGLTSVGGYLYVQDYAHPLPSSLTAKRVIT